MAVPTSIALDDETDPARTKKFEAALGVGGVAARSALRALVDAYCAYVKANGRVPTFPLTIVSGDSKPAVKPR